MPLLTSITPLARSLRDPRLLKHGMGADHPFCRSQNRAAGIVSLCCIAQRT